MALVISQEEQKTLNKLEVFSMKHFCIILLFLCILPSSPGCRQAQEEPGAIPEKNPVQEQVRKKPLKIPETTAETKPQNPMKLDSEDAKLKIVAGAENVLGVELENKVPIRGVQFTLMGAKITEISTTERTKGYFAKFNEATGKVILVSMSGDKIEPGTGPIAEIVCNKGADASLSEITIVR